MRLPFYALAGLVPLVGTVLGESAVLKFKTYRDWDLILPKERSLRVSGSIGLEGMSRKFRTGLSGTGLEIDRDGDGAFDVKVTGESGLVTLRGESAKGDRLHYSLRLANRGSGWEALPGGAVVGSVEGQQVRVIDQNLNGRFDDYGEDALIVGRGRQAGFLSRVIEVRGKLFSMEVSSDGSSLSYEPYAGRSGVLDVSTEFASKGKLLGAVVVSEDGQHSFTLSGRPMAVPAGDYHLYNGRIGLGRNVVTFSRGQSQPTTVNDGQKQVMALGEPIRIDFKYVRQPGRVIVAPQLVSYVGRGGERYDQWTPFGGSPQFDVRDVETGKQIALAVFGGC